MRPEFIVVPTAAMWMMLSRISVLSSEPLDIALVKAAMELMRTQGETG